MAALIKNRRGGRFQIFWQIQIRRAIKPRRCLKINFLHDELIVRDASRNDGLQIRPLRHRPQSEHLLQLPAILATLRLPFIQRIDVGQAMLRKRGGLVAEIIGEHRVAGRGLAGELVNLRGAGQECSEKERHQEKARSLHENIMFRTGTTRQEIWQCLVGRSRIRPFARIML